MTFKPRKIAIDKVKKFKNEKNNLGIKKIKHFW